jgi:hypothetical protein
MDEKLVAITWFLLTVVFVAVMSAIVHYAVELDRKRCEKAYQNRLNEKRQKLSKQLQQRHGAGE